MFWLSLTTFFIIAKIWGHLTFSWWWLILLFFIDLIEFLINSMITAYKAGLKDLIDDEIVVEVNKEK